MTDLNHTETNPVILRERAKNGDEWATQKLGNTNLSHTQVVKLLEKCTGLTLLGAPTADIDTIGKYLSMGNATKLEDWEMLALRKWVRK